MMDETLLLKNLKFLSSLEGLPQKLKGNVVASEILLKKAMQMADFAGCTLDELCTVDLKLRESLKSSPVKLLLMDVDGVLADGGMYFTEKGDEIKRFSSRDGLALKKIAQSGIITGIISSGISSKAIKHRADMLGIKHVYVGSKAKLEVFEKWSAKLNITAEQTAYIGDDLSDIPLMQTVGLSVCPVDAASAVRKVVKLVLKTKGGQGCVREFIEDYLMTSLKGE